jgi:damage-control phosphatase, subfamily I
MAGLGEAAQREAVLAAERALVGTDHEVPPAVVATAAIRAAEGLYPGIDPFLEMKVRTTREALALYERVKPGLESDLAWVGLVERVRLSAKLAAAGNIIDFGVGLEFDLEATLAETLATPLAIDHSDALARALIAGDSLLIVSDNAGEIVFDRFLMDEALRLGKQVYLSVKSGPVINDAMRDDVVRAGIGDPVRVIETGSSSLGIVFEECSEEFQDVFWDAGVVLSKGQANYETLDAAERSVFFILRAKCPIVARELEVPAGASVLLEKPGE